MAIVSRWVLSRHHRPLKEYTSEFGEPSAFTYGVLRSMMVAYVPD